MIKVNPKAKRLRILIMDDEEMVRDIVGEMLESFGHETFSAKDGEEALKIHKKAIEDNIPIDLTIMDLVIPEGMGGKEAIQKLLKIDPKAKVVVFSGYSNDPIMENFTAYGFCAAFPKPNSFGNFKNLINRVVYKNSD